MTNNKNNNNKLCFKINIIIYEIQVLITTKNNNNLIKEQINERGRFYGYQFPNSLIISLEFFYFVLLFILHLQ